MAPLVSWRLETKRCIEKCRWKFKDKECIFLVRFVPFLAKIHPASDVIPKIFKNKADQANITIGSNINVDSVTLKMWFINLAIQNVLISSIFLQSASCKTWK